MSAADGGDPLIEFGRKHDDRRLELAAQQAQESSVPARAGLREQLLQKGEIPGGQLAPGWRGERRRGKRRGHGKPPSRPDAGPGAPKVGRSCWRIVPWLGRAVAQPRPGVRRLRRGASRGAETAYGKGRSEGHTSELQSLMRISYAVFCLK